MPAVGAVALKIFGPMIAEKVVSNATSSSGSGSAPAGGSEGAPQAVAFDTTAGAAAVNDASAAHIEALRAGLPQQNQGNV